jgi:hypothetical protein
MVTKKRVNPIHSRELVYELTARTDHAQNIACAVGHCSRCVLNFWIVDRLSAFLAGLVENARFNSVIGSAVLAINDHLDSEEFDELRHIIGSSKIQQVEAAVSPKILTKLRALQNMMKAPFSDFSI